MEETLQQIPAEAWPLIDLMFNITVTLTLAWLLWSVLVWWRRSSSNLTSVRASEPNKKAQPDFLKSDKKARAEAIKRGESFEKELERRERHEAKELKRASRHKESLGRRLVRLISLGMALFTMATMISGTLFQVSIMGRYWEQYSAEERLMTVVQEHPIGVAVTVAVILYNIITFALKLNSEEA